MVFALRRHFSSTSDASSDSGFTKGDSAFTSDGSVRDSGEEAAAEDSGEDSGARDATDTDVNSADFAGQSTSITPKGTADSTEP